MLLKIILLLLGVAAFSVLLETLEAFIVIWRMTRKALRENPHNVARGKEIAKERAAAWGRAKMRRISRRFSWLVNIEKDFNPNNTNPPNWVKRIYRLEFNIRYSGWFIGRAYRHLTTRGKIQTSAMYEFTHPVFADLFLQYINLFEAHAKGGLAPGSSTTSSSARTIMTWELGI